MPDQRDWNTGEVYVGPERRADRVALSTALDDVRGTKSTVERLIDTLSPMATAKQLLEVRKMLIVLYVVQVATSIVFMVFLILAINGGHRAIVNEQRVTQCLETQAEAAKVADPTKAVATCRQAEVRP